MTDSPPLSRPLVVADVPPGGVRIEIVADEAERAALASLNETLSIARLVASLDVRPTAGDGLVVSGRLEAEAERTCGVTLDPFVEEVREYVSVRFAPASDLAPHEPNAEIEIGAIDPPDPYDGGVVDLGAVVAEFFTLGLDPHPRKPGAVLDLGGEDDRGASPFAALAKLAGRDGAL